MPPIIPSVPQILRKLFSLSSIFGGYLKKYIGALFSIKKTPFIPPLQFFQK